VSEQDNPDALFQRAAAWARTRVRLSPRHDRTGHHGIRWVATLHVDNLLFEHEEFGDYRNRESLRRRASDAVVQDFLNWTADMFASGAADALPRFEE
jgi:hypothetical protein